MRTGWVCRAPLPRCCSDFPRLSRPPCWGRRRAPRLNRTGRAAKPPRPINPGGGRASPRAPPPTASPARPSRLSPLRGPRACPCPGSARGTPGCRRERGGFKGRPLPPLRPRPYRPGGPARPLPSAGSRREEAAGEGPKPPPAPGCSRAPGALRVRDLNSFNPK